MDQAKERLAAGEVWSDLDLVSCSTRARELRTVMELLGHSTIRMTADTYGHVLPARGSSGGPGH